jgi:ketosteroid isomerase-like protein
VVQQWLDAWEQQEVDNFFSYYHTDFAPLYQSTRAAWRVDRQSRIAGPAAIEIELEEFRVGTASALGTTVSFWMTYRAPNYADRTLKEVLIGPDVDGQWRILQEFNREVAVLPRDGRAGAPAQIAAVLPGATTQGVAGPRTPVAVVPGPSTLSTPRAVTPPQTDEAGIGSFIAQWLNAWQAQDVDGYFSHYHPDFKPAAIASVQAWRNDRILKITRPQAIRLQMDELQVLEAGAQTAQIEFLLTYYSTHYADRTLKALRLGKAGNGDWRITDERNRRVEPLPLVRLLTALVTPPFTVDIASL